MIETHIKTPNDLADALESGEYKHLKGALAGEKGEGNCCLGVALLEIGVPHGALQGQAMPESLGPDDRKSFGKAYPWMYVAPEEVDLGVPRYTGDDNSDEDEVMYTLAVINDHDNTKSFRRQITYLRKLHKAGIHLTEETN